jgi:hypothetical protein
LTGAGRERRKVVRGLHKNFVHAHMKFLAKPSVKNGTRSLRSVIEKSLKPTLLNSIQNVLKTLTNHAARVGSHIFVGRINSYKKSDFLALARALHLSEEGTVFILKDHTYTTIF